VEGKKSRVCAGSKLHLCLKTSRANPEEKENPEEEKDIYFADVKESWKDEFMRTVQVQSRYRQISTWRKSTQIVQLA